MRSLRKLVLASALVFACSSPTASTPGVDAGKDVHKDAFVPPPDEDAGPTYRVSGNVLDTAAKPWSGAAVQVCGTVCNVAFADAAGAWTADSISPEGKHLRVEGAPKDGRNWTPVVYHIEVNADLVVTTPTIVPETPTPIALTAGSKVVNVGEVSITFDDATLTGSTHVFSDVRVPKTIWPPYDAAGKTIVAMWGLIPFGAKSPTPMPVSLDASTLGLAAGDKVTLFSVDSDTGLLVEPVPATVSSDGTRVVSDSGSGLLHLTWIVLAK